MIRLPKYLYSTSISATKKAQIVSIPFKKLLSNDESVMEQIDMAYSDKGLGALSISDVPTYADLRKKMLLLS